MIVKKYALKLQTWIMLNNDYYLHELTHKQAFKCVFTD